MKLRKSTNQRGFPFFLGVPFPRLRWHAPVFAGRNGEYQSPSHWKCHSRWCKSKRVAGWDDWNFSDLGGSERVEVVVKSEPFFSGRVTREGRLFFSHMIYTSILFLIYGATVQRDWRSKMPCWCHWKVALSLSLSLFDHFFEEANCEEGHGYPSLFTCSKFYLCIVHSFFPSFRSFFRFFPLIVSFFDSMYQYFSMYLAIFLSIFLSINLSIYFMDVSSVYLCIFLCT